MKHSRQWKTKIGFLLAGLTLAVAPISGMIMPGIALAATATCTWTGSGDGTSWNDATNWSGCGGAPQNGDNLAFDISSLSSPANLNNNISNLQVGNIAFTGTNTNVSSYIIGGNAITLSDGITNSASFPSTVDLDITLTANQTFSSDTPGLDIGDTSTTLNVGSYNLDLAGNISSAGSVDIYSIISGTGALDFSGAGEANFIDNNNPNFSGPITISSGGLIINARNTDQLGTGPVSITSGASLQESINNNGTYTIANPITTAGAGVSGTGALIVHGYSVTGTVNFTGPITLASDTQIGLTSANADFSGTVSGCGYSITKTSSSSGTLSGNLTGSCTADLGSGSSNSNSGSGTNTSGSGGSGTNTKAPDTGYGQPTPSSTLITILIAGAIISSGAGIALLYRQKKFTNSPNS